MNEKLQKLENLIRSCGSCLIAYSGGVDSFFLAYVATRTLGDKALAVISDTPSLPRRELIDAISLAKKFNINLSIIKSNEFNNPQYLANPVNRCYFCKKDLFSEMSILAKLKGINTIFYGENADDTDDFRPGANAASEFNVRAPLKELGFTKADIRQISAQLGLPTANKPQMACLSSRIPYGEKVTPQKLKMIEESEYFLNELGLINCRVRHHEISGGHLARIEVSPSEMPKLFNPDIISKIALKLKELGYSYVTMDLLGYRRGSLNEIIKPA